jgi:rhodanese-related sulfurtransferase
MKVLFSPKDGKILGAQAVGVDGADKRMDVIATGMHHGATLDDLVDYELCYAPPFGSAKDAVNIAGMVGQNHQRKLVEIIHWSEVASRVASGSKLLDVREPKEIEAGAIPNATNIPLGQLRKRIQELDKTADWIVYCQSGQRSYNACRILSQQGFRCGNLSGAFKTYSAANPKS